MPDNQSPRPVTGLWFEELTPGLVIHHAIRRTITEADNVAFTIMTMNPAPIRVETEVLDARPSKSHPAQGVVTLEHRAYSAGSETLVCKAVRTALMHRRPPQ